jgi:hypothetical protein
LILAAPKKNSSDQGLPFEHLWGLRNEILRKKVWAIAEGYIPGESIAPAPESRRTRRFHLECFAGESARRLCAALCVFFSFGASLLPNDGSKSSNTQKLADLTD